MNSKSLTNKWQKRTLPVQTFPVRSPAGSPGGPSVFEGPPPRIFSQLWAAGALPQKVSRMKSSFALGFVIHRGKV